MSELQRKFVGTALRSMSLDSGATITELGYEAGKVVQLHGHQRPYVSLVLNGAFEDEADRRRDWCTAGSVLIRPCGVSHGTTYGQRGARQVSIDFDADAVRTCFAEPSVSKNPRLALLLRGVYEELAYGDKWSALVLDGLASQLLGLLGRENVECARPSWTRIVEERMRDEKSEPTITELAAIARLPYSRFTLEFKRWFGCTPGAYLRRLRLERCERMLVSTELTLAQIAAIVGFADHPHLAREFKSWRGISPSEYRRQLR